MNILITGASRGLGKAMAEILKSNGHHIAAPTRAEMNLQDAKSITKYCERVQRYGLKFDVIINNAGGLIEGDRLRDLMNLNALGPIFFTESMQFMLNTTARIINISSREGLSGDTFGYRNYSVSKATLNAITRMFAKRSRNVTFNACCPGPFNSKDHAACLKAADTPVWLATEAPRSTGKFYINREVVPW